MNGENINNNDSEKSAAQILQEINAGQLDPRLLDSEGRKCCIEILMSEGYTISHMAQILKRNEKTIRRDLKDIRARHSLLPSQKFPREFMGQLVFKALNHAGYLMRVARSKDALPGEKTQAEYAAWKVLKELAEQLQVLGYLPQVFVQSQTEHNPVSRKQDSASAGGISGAHEEGLKVAKAMEPMDRQRLIERLTWIATEHPNASPILESMKSMPGKLTKWLRSQESDPT